MYKVKNENNQESKSVLTSTRLKDATRVRRPLSRGSSSKNNVLSHTKSHSADVEVHVKSNKKTNAASQKNVTNVDVKNAPKAKDVLCVSCAKNVVQIVLWNVNSACESNLYTISISEMETSSPICLMSKATSTKSQLWHRRLSHLNFSTISDLIKPDLFNGLLKFNTHSKLELIHMDLCGPMRVESINGKKYILVIVDDYSRYTWVYFLRTKDETPEMIKKFIAQAHYEKLGIMQQFSIARSPQQNGVVERRNRTLIEAARTMLIFSKSPEFLWAKAILTACFTQNRSLIHTRYNKTPYELLRRRKPNVEYFHVFRSLCYPTNDSEYFGKMKPKADIGIFIGY
ncbi:retrovirus-related pol polyprotein from transposon TNT 1-94 [Tanacetum coccineum]